MCSPAAAGGSPAAPLLRWPERLRRPERRATAGPAVVPDGGDCYAWILPPVACVTCGIDVAPLVVDCGPCGVSNYMPTTLASLTALSSSASTMAHAANGARDLAMEGKRPVPAPFPTSRGIATASVAKMIGRRCPS